MHILAYIVLTALCGCLTIEKENLPGSEPGTHVFIRNYGKYLFNCVPVWCGNVEPEPRCRFVMFRDDVTMDKVQHRFFAECSTCKGEVTDIAYHSNDDIFLKIPLWSFDIPIPYLWTHHEIQISGVVK